ncbi:ead/Ea22-like family protein [Glutamicibacter sp. NPDC127525]|uniref:ead/Ea22-like family protein n=1 Tax=unclassified Glutamicibacter TaxID=2627139 RepID=UPI0036315195
MSQPSKEVQPTANPSGEQRRMHSGSVPGVGSMGVPTTSTGSHATNLDTLRKIAEAEETQKWGGWAFEEDDFDGFCIYINDGDDFGRSYVAKDLTQGESEGESTAEFIATFDPPTVLALLSRLEQAEQHLDAALEANKRWAHRSSRERSDLHKTEQAVARVRELNQFLPASIMERVIRALDGDTRG